MFGHVHHRAGRQSSPLLLEIAGLAGAGKTTLLRALTKQDPHFRIVNDLEIRDPTHLPIFMSHARFLCSLLHQWRRAEGRFTWDEMKAMVYLQSWPVWVRTQTRSGDAAVLLNHGPIFKLATLLAFGPAVLRSQRFEPWWQAVFAQWAATLELIVWLDAPAHILIERINMRRQRHAVKGKSEIEAANFLTRYQHAYEHVLAKMVAHGGPTPLRLDSSRSSVEFLVNEVLSACRQTRSHVQSSTILRSNPS